MIIPHEARHKMLLLSSLAAVVVRGDGHQTEERGKVAPTLFHTAPPDPLVTLLTSAVVLHSA